MFTAAAHNPRKRLQRRHFRWFFLSQMSELGRKLSYGSDVLSKIDFLFKVQSVIRYTVLPLLKHHQVSQILDRTSSSKGERFRREISKIRLNGLWFILIEGHSFPSHMN